MSHLRTENGIDLPDEYASIIVMLDCGPYGFIPFAGCRIGDVFHMGHDCYHFDNIEKWDYIREVLPDYEVKLKAEM